MNKPLGNNISESKNGNNQEAISQRHRLDFPWDPSCVTAGNMPYHLVVRGYDRGTHLLEFAGSILQDEQRH